jgi:hypothetical protein
MGHFQQAARGTSEQFRLFIILDEAKIMSLGKRDANDPDCILNRLFTEIRKFGIGLIVASQMREHFGAEVRANAAIKLVLKPMDVPEARRNADVVQVAPEALLSLQGAGEGFLGGGTMGRAQKIQVRRLSMSNGPLLSEQLRAEQGFWMEVAR